MQSLRILFTLFSICFVFCLNAQDARLEGTVLGPDNKPQQGVSVVVEEIPSIGTATDAQGKFTLQVPAGKKITILFRSIQSLPLRKTVKLKAGESYELNAGLQDNVINIDSVDVKANKQRTEAGTVEFKPIETMVTPNGSLESQLKYIGLGVRGVGGELSSAYNVRGGSFDENLVYVNDFEVYRPYLVRSGQQEGLSFANPDMVSNIKFSSGGFQAKYGDKLASVMDVTYKRPKKFGLTAYGSLLGAGLHVEAASKDTSFTFLFGFRNRSAQYLISSLQTKGQYSPTFYDAQTYMTWDIKPQHRLEFIGQYANNQFKFFPEDRQTDFGLVNKVVRLNMYFEGAEHDKYQTIMGGLAYTYFPHEKVKLKFLGSYYNTKEREAYNIIAEYFLGEVETDFTKENFNEVKYGLGTGLTQNWARNELFTQIINAKHLGSWFYRNHHFQWGFSYKHERINDALYEWGLLDSTGYTLPFSVEQVNVQRFTQGSTQLRSNRYEAFIQDSWRTGDKNVFFITGGARVQYWDLNKEWLFSPRVQLSLKPNVKQDFTVYFSTGLYQQAPFYREMRNLEGVVNTNLKAQKSVHAVLGADLNFYAWKRPFKFTTEMYYKYLWSLVPYELDNVLIRYFGTNSARGYAYGIDLRLHGELVPGEESWISLSLLNTRENLLNDSYTEYFDSTGNKVYKGTPGGRLITDSATVFPGSLPRPTDQRVAFSLFFQDHIPKLPELRVHVNMDFATGLPFGPPDNRKDLDTLRIPSYKRVDIGFSGQLYNHAWKKHHIHKTIFKHLKSIWLSFEVWNILGINNTVSYLWVKDFNNINYAVPNYLSNRRFNARLLIKF